jgi:RHS repeat-associated protein
MIHFKKTILFLFIGLVFAASAWAVPPNWGVFVPTGAQYISSRGGAIGKDWGCSDCGGYDRTAIDHFKWYCCGACVYCPGYLCTDEAAFDLYQVIGNYYDCEGNLLEKGAAGWGRWLIIRGTGTIFSGGIGGQDEGFIVGCVPTWCSPARDCRIHADMSPQLNSCPYGYPSVPSPTPEKDLGSPRSGGCDQFVGNPINVATGNKYEGALDIRLSSPGIPLEFRRSYNSLSDRDGSLGHRWTHNFNLRLEEVESQPERKIILWDSDGRALYFHQVRKEAGSEDIRFAGESRVKDRLRQDSLTGEYFLRRKEKNLTYRFDSNGKLIEISDFNGNKITLTYTGGLLSQVSNNFGKSLSFQYNAPGRIKAVKDPKGQSVLYEYLNGDLTQVTYPDQNSLSYAYLGHNLIDKYDTDLNLIGHWEYDNKNRVKTYYSHLRDGVAQNRIDLKYQFLKTEVTNSKGKTTYTIGMLGGISLVKEIKGCSSCGSLHKKLSYNNRLDLISVTSVIDGKEITTRYTYDNPTTSWMQVGEVVEMREALGWVEEQVTSYTYTHRTDDPFLLMEGTETKASVLVTGQNRVTRWNYDAQGNPISREETGYALVDNASTPKTYKTDYGYNSLGQLTSIDGPRTNVSDLTTFEYYENTPSQGSNRGQLKAIINAVRQRTLFSNYDANGNVGKITDPNGVVTQYTYDQRNRIKVITNLTRGAKTRYFYDSHGNLSLAFFPEGNGIQFFYDQGNHLTDIEDSLGNAIHYEYDQEGNRSREETRDPEGVLKKSLDFAYDSYNRLSKIITPDSTFTEYTYDGNGNQKTIKDPRGNKTEYTYDPLNRPREMKQLAKPEDILTSYEYDSHDNLTAVTDGNGNTTEYLYDDFRRLAQTLSPDTGTTTYLYDEARNLIQKKDQKGTATTYTYDALNRLTSLTFPDPSQNITYSYDDPSSSYGIGRLTGMIDPSGSYAFHYDAQGNLIKEVKRIENITYTTKYTYNKNNTLLSITYPSGKTVTYTLNEIDSVSRVAAGSGSGAKPLASSVSYLPFGGMTTLSYGNGLSLSHNHDSQYRISSIQIQNLFNRIYEHDPNGNVTSITDRINPNWSPPIEKPETYSYETATNRLSQIIGETPISFGYDLNGNTASANNRIYNYDYSNQLTSVIENDTKIAEYVYNGAGQRIKKVTQDETRIFHYDTLGHLIAETDQKGMTLAEYVYLGDQPLAMMEADGSAYYFHNDHLGTPQMLTDQTKGVVWKTGYGAFGEVNILIETIENPFRFPGQYYDKETGLHYNYFRYYSPKIGRYITPDPIGLEGGINLYVYAGNNPTNQIDSFGLKWVFVGWDVQNVETMWTKYRVLLAVCHDDCQRGRLELRTVTVFYQQWYPFPINVPELKPPTSNPFSPKDPANAFVDLMEAILKCKKGTEENLFTLQMEQEGQKYCDRFNR